VSTGPEVPLDFLSGETQIEDDDNTVDEATTEQELNDPYNNPFAYEFFNTPATANTGTAFHEADSMFALIALMVPFRRWRN